MPRVIVIGGGLAGLSAAAALGSAGFDVELLESRPFPGGRATSFAHGSEVIDNCQHVLLRCCANLLDFYRRLGVVSEIRFHDRIAYLEPGGRASYLRGGSLASFLGLRFLSPADKLSVARGLIALRRELGRPGLDDMPMGAWLEEKRQTPMAIRRFWSPILVSAINEELGRMAAAHAFQVFALGLFSGRAGSRMGVPTVPLASLYAEERWRGLGRVRFHLSSKVEHVALSNGRARAVTAAGSELSGDFFICAVPVERVAGLLPGLVPGLEAFEHSPITGIHLWFDRPVTALPHAVLLDRTIQWFFNKQSGRYLQIVVSASRGLIDMPRREIVELGVRELAEFLPAAGSARLERGHVIKELRATFSARPGLEALRPPNATAVENLFLAGDWTRTGWPATMEGAVRSGYLAAEAVARAAGAPARFLVS